MNLKNMTGEEFGKILKDAAHLSGKTTVELVAGFGATMQTICAMYQNRYDTGVNKIMKFLNVIGFHITIINRDTKKETEFYDNDEVVEFIRQAMVSENLTYSNLATKFDVSVGRAHRLLNGSVAIRLSLFLKVLELNNYSLRLDAD
jgi:prophage maintenance system killer protein